MTRYVIFFLGRSEKIVDETCCDAVSDELAVLAAEQTYQKHQPFISGFEIWQGMHLVCRKINLGTIRNNTT